ncbi:MAG TPA: hypothetical protein VND96_13265 [Candidatus Micrarchaeaceae archaeon]|nr:hypothetical protein [Candidatus Micrarchaeaceae archaeon]
MSAARYGVMSDILAATGKAGMQAAAGERFWDWRRIVLAVGYGLGFVAGALLILAADPNGLVLMVAAVAGVLFIHRTWLGVGVWIYVLLTGGVAVASHNDLGFYGVVAGLGFGFVALPIWSHRPTATKELDVPATQSRLAAPASALVAAPMPLAEPISPSVSAGRGGVEPGYKPAPAAPIFRTIGRIQLLTSSADLTASLMGKPVIGFLWLYLLARSVRTVGDRVTRASITDEVAHGVNDPRGRLRGYLRDLTRLPAPLGSMIKVEDEMIGFDLGEQDADYAQLRRLALRVRQASGSLDDELLRLGRLLLSELGDGEFLTGFEDMEKRVTQGRGVAGQVVAEVRVQIDGMRADLADAVAKALLDRGQAPLAVALLEPIVARSVERDDLARTLINALRDCGQHTRAAEIRRRFAGGQEN